MKKVKISELPLYNSLKGLFTLGTDKDNRSVKVSLEFIETTTEAAVKKATDAATDAERRTTAAVTQAQSDVTAAAAGAKQIADNAAASAKKTAEDAAAAAKKKADDAAADAQSKTAAAVSSANSAATNANQKASAAETAAQVANAAATSANSAAQAAQAAKTAAETATTQTIQAKNAAETATAQANVAAEGATQAKANAETATGEAQEATAEAIDATSVLLNFLGTILPNALSVEPVPRLTFGNKTPVRINAVLSPSGVRQNIIFISDGKAVTVAPDGRLTVVGVGRSVVQVIPTINTALAQVIEVVVGEPTVRFVNTRTRLRLTQSGAFRLN